MARYNPARLFNNPPGQPVIICPLPPPPFHFPKATSVNSELFDEEQRQRLDGIQQRYAQHSAQVMQTLEQERARILQRGFAYNSEATVERSWRVLLSSRLESYERQLEGRTTQSDLSDLRAAYKQAMQGMAREINALRLAAEEKGEKLPQLTDELLSENRRLHAFMIDHNAALLRNAAHGSTASLRAYSGMGSDSVNSSHQHLSRIGGSLHPTTILESDIQVRTTT
jgi:hypothetical protein